MPQPLSQQPLPFESIEQMFERVFAHIKPKSPCPEFIVYFYPYAGIDSKIRISPDGSWVEVKISDQLETAPARVQEALAYVLLSKLYVGRVPPNANRTYKEYIRSPSVLEKATEIRRRRGRKRIVHPKGEHHDLNEVFAEINEQFFSNTIEKPHIGWSLSPSEQLLGHYDPAHSAIVISCVFDSSKIPRFLLEFVMYHEMLHIKHPVEYREDGRRSIHTPAFKREERKFPRYKEASAMLKRLSNFSKE
jgi:predicted metal-dependent hydrolase